MPSTARRINGLNIPNSLSPSLPSPSLLVDTPRAPRAGKLVPGPPVPRLLPTPSYSRPSYDSDTTPKLTHSRNASASITGVVPRTRPNLRQKKSLPDLRQSHAQILDDRMGSESERNASLAAALHRPRGTSIGLGSPSIPPSPQLATRPPLSTNTSSSTLNSMNQSSPPSPSVKLVEFPKALEPPVNRAPPPSSSGVPKAIYSRKGADSEGRPPVGVDRNSGAYFRRLSMLPASSISKSVPIALLSFVDAIRGVLFALSQIYSALKQYVVFATQDRLPGSLAKMMTNADGSMSRLINALDRFDSSTRRSTPDSSVVRELFDTCRENVAVFGKLVGVLSIQLKVLTTAADVRYTRTLLLTLYGSMAEVASAWAAMAPQAADIAILLHSDSATLILQPPTPSPKFEATVVPNGIPNAPLPPPGAFRPPPLGPPSSLVRTSKARRHAGSFSVEDVQLGAILPPATSPTEATSNTPLSNPLSASTSSISSLVSTPPPSMKPRVGAPKLTALPLPISTPPGTGTNFPAVKDIFAHLSEMPPTPIAARPSTPLTLDPILNSSTSSHGRMPSDGQSTSLSLPDNPPRPSTPTFSSGSATVESDFLDMVESTTNIAFNVFSLVSESLQTDLNRTRKSDELLELCSSGNEVSKLLKSSLEKLRSLPAETDQSYIEFLSRWKPLTLQDSRKLWEDSNAFARVCLFLLFSCLNSCLAQ